MNDKEKYDEWDPTPYSKPDVEWLLFTAEQTLEFEAERFAVPKQNNGWKKDQIADFRHPGASGDESE